MSQRVIVAGILVFIAFNVTQGSLPFLYHGAGSVLDSTVLKTDFEVRGEDQETLFQLWYEIPRIRLLKGSIFFSGSLFYNQISHYGTHPQKVFYTRNSKRGVFGAGLGYGYEQIRQSRLENATININDTENAFERLVVDYRNISTLFGNINGVAHVKNSYAWVYGSEITVELPRGFIYEETCFPSDRKIDLNYHNYGENACDLTVHGGVGLWKRGSMGERPISRLMHVTYTCEWNRNDLRYEPFDHPQMNYQITADPTIHYIRDDACLHAITFSAEMADLYPERVTIDLPLRLGFLKTQAELEELKLAVSYRYMTGYKQIVNRWNRTSGIYWGETSRKENFYQTHFAGTQAVKLFVCKYLYLRPYWESDNFLRRYDTEHLFCTQIEAGFGFGLRVPLKSRYLLETGYGGLKLGGDFKSLQKESVGARDMVSYQNEWALKVSMKEMIFFRFTLLR